MTTDTRRLLTRAEVRELHSKLLAVNKALALDAGLSLHERDQLIALKAAIVARLTQSGGLDS